jgi:hypothetical protein
MDFVLFAFSTRSHEWAGPPQGETGSWADIAPTVYTIGTIVCLAVLLVWWGVVRVRR